MEKFKIFNNEKEYQFIDPRINNYESYDTNVKTDAWETDLNNLLI